MYSNEFEQALKFVLEYEGGCVNNPNDPGGATNKGITQGTYNSWRKSKGLAVKDVKLITNEEVKDFLTACQYNDLEVYFFKRIRYYNNLAKRANIEAGGKTRCIFPSILLLTTGAIISGNPLYKRV